MLGYGMMHRDVREGLEEYLNQQQIFPVHVYHEMLIDY
jgi:hypothetical protein